MIYEVILDPRERPNKCTIAPLRGHPSFRLFAAHPKGPLGPLTASILLHPEGKCLTLVRREIPQPSALGAIDCVWPRLEGILSRVVGGPRVLAKIPTGFRTAYLRGSKLGEPTGGLATIEALFIASALLGDWDTSILAHYYFGKRFVEINADRFVELGVPQAKDAMLFPTLVNRERNALQRRRDRGRLSE